MAFLPRLLLITALAARAAAQAADPQELLQQGLQAYQRRDFDAALNVWLKGLSLAQEQRDDLLVGSFHGNLGIIYGILGDDAKAIEHFEESLRLAREVGDFLGLKNRLNNVAAFYLKAGDLDTALARLEEALPMTRDLGDRPLECRTLANIGEVYLRQQKNHQAVETLRESLAIATEIELAELEINILSQLGLAYSAMGNYPLALNHFRWAIAITQKGDDGPNRAALLIRDYNRMGALVRDLGDPAAAIAFHQSAVEQAKSVGATALLASSEQQLADARAEAAGSADALHRLRVDGLKRMLARLNAHGLRSLAAQVERQIAKLEEESKAKDLNAPAVTSPARGP